MKRATFILFLLFTLALWPLIAINQGPTITFDDSFQNQMFTTELREAFTKSITELFSWRDERTKAECQLEFSQLSVLDNLYATCIFRLHCGERELQRMLVINPLKKRQLSAIVLEQLQYDVAQFFATEESNGQIDYTLKGSFSAIDRSGAFHQSTLVSVLDGQQQLIGLLRVSGHQQDVEEPLVELHRLWAKQKILPGMPLELGPVNWRWQLLLGSSLEQLDLGVRFSRYLLSYPFVFATTLKSSLPYSLLAGQKGFSTRVQVELGVHIPLSFLFALNGKSCSDFAFTGALGAGVGGAQLSSGLGAFIYGGEVNVGFEWYLNPRIQLALELTYRQWVALREAVIENYDSNQNRIVLALVVGFAW